MQIGRTHLGRANATGRSMTTGLRADGPWLARFLHVQELAAGPVPHLGAHTVTLSDPETPALPLKHAEVGRGIIRQMSEHKADAQSKRQHAWLSGTRSSAKAAHGSCIHRDHVLGQRLPGMSRMLLTLWAVSCPAFLLMQFGREYVLHLERFPANRRLTLELKRVTVGPGSARRRRTAFGNRAAHRKVQSRMVLIGVSCR